MKKCSWKILAGLLFVLALGVGGAKKVWGAEPVYCGGPCNVEYCGGGGGGGVCYVEACLDAMVCSHLDVYGECDTWVNGCVLTDAVEVPCPNDEPCCTTICDETHLACSGSACIQVEGAGGNECSSSADCSAGGGSSSSGGGGCDPNDWGPWGSCTVTCGGGTQIRVNDCSEIETRDCNTQACCVETNPGGPNLTGPADGSKQTGLTADLSWSGVNFGYGCPSNNNQYRLYVEAGDSTPDTLVATLGSGTGSYSFSGVVDRRYYWQVVASNGSRTTASAVRSFYTPGLVTGTLFDASETDSCALMAGEPKISGAVVNITGPSSYTPTSDVLGIYSQYVLSPDNYTLSVSPGEGYLLPPKLTCQGFSANFSASGSTATRDFGFWRVYGGWFQAVGGDVYGGGGIENIIPATLPAEERYLIKEDVNGNGGLAYYRTGELELGGGSGVAVSQKGWQAESGYGGQDANYEYYTAKMRIFEKTDWDGEGKPDFAPKADDDWEIYTHTGNAYIDFDVVGLEKMIFMVDGDVTVTGDVLVEKGAHLTVIASGNITFEDDVSQAQGWWVADRIVIESTGDEATEIQFRGEGSFVGYDAIEFNRDRGVTNNSEPTEIFTYRPDMMTNAPGAIKLPRFHWSEQVP